MNKRMFFPGIKNVDSQANSSEVIEEFISKLCLEDQAYLLQRLSSDKHIIAGPCFPKDVQGCISVNSGPFSGSVCVGGKQGDVGGQIARAFGAKQAWSASLEAKNLELDLVSLNDEAAGHGYRPFLALDEGKCVLGFVPFEGSKGQLVSDPYEACKSIFGPLVSKGVGISIGVSIPL
jgi:hypothetical protein